MALQSLSFAGARFRAGSWRGRDDLAYLVPLSAATTLDQRALRAAREELRDRGFTAVVTAAVAPAERAAFLGDDFVDHEYLHLLRFDLHEELRVPRLPAGLRLGRGRHREWPAILELDARSFDDFWRLDHAGLHDSLDATPSSRLRVVRTHSAVIGYSVAGRAGSQGYLQRLAVDPPWEGSGIGTVLVFDALRWMRRRGAGVAWVNTQERNERALQLYLHLGFRLEDHKLTVLRRELR